MFYLYMCEKRKSIKNMNIEYIELYKRVFMKTKKSNPVVSIIVTIIASSHSLKSLIFSTCAFWDTVPAKGLDTPSHSMVFMVADWHLTGRRIFGWFQRCIWAQGGSSGAMHKWTQTTLLQQTVCCHCPEELWLLPTKQFPTVSFLSRCVLIWMK